MNNKSLTKTAFTLIELLVVIAIIGILSGLIIVGMSSSVNSARIAKSQIFASSLRDSILSNLVSDWSFDGMGVADGGAAITAYTQDLWGSNNCTMPGTAPLVYSGSNCIYGSCLRFNGSSDYLSCGTNPLFMPTNSITLASWVFPNSSKTSGSIIERENSSWVAYLLEISGSRASLEVGYQGTAPYTITAAGTTDIRNAWHYVVGTYDHSNVRIFVDAVQEGIAANTNDIYYTLASPTRISYHANTASMFFNGSIDGVRLYNSAIPTSLIEEFYYAGINRLFANKIISNNEYQKRLEALTNNFAKK